MEAAFRSELHRPATIVFTIVAGTLLIAGIIVFSRRAKERPEIKPRVAETREMAPDDDPGLREVVASVECPTLNNSVEPRGHEPAWDRRVRPETLTRGVAIEQAAGPRAAEQTGGGGRTDLAQAPQHTSPSWFELSQKHWQRNFDGLNKLTRSQSVQEFTAIGSEMVREGLQQMAEDSRVMLETSVRVVDQAGKAFSGLAQVGRPNVH